MTKPIEPGCMVLVHSPGIDCYVTTALHRLTPKEIATVETHWKVKNSRCRRCKSDISTYWSLAIAGTSEFDYACTCVLTRIDPDEETMNHVACDSVLDRMWAKADRDDVRLRRP